MSDKIKVILDCDTGSDDAVAIMMAILSPKIDLLGVSTVAGNKEIGFTTDNTLRVVDMLRSTPVYRGCATSMVAKLLPNRHGDYTGMTGVKADKLDEKGEVISYHHDCLPMPAPVSREQPEHGVWWLIDTLMQSEGDITLIPTGPLTNIGMALRLEPRIAEKIRQIIFMGGGFKVFNATAASEFNIWADPEAAQIVLTSGVKTITMVPLDATHQACARLAPLWPLRWQTWWTSALWPTTPTSPRTSRIPPPSTTPYAWPTSLTRRCSPTSAICGWMWT